MGNVVQRKSFEMGGEKPDDSLRAPGVFQGWEVEKSPEGYPTLDVATCSVWSLLQKLTRNERSLQSTIDFTGNPR